MCTKCSVWCYDLLESDTPFNKADHEMVRISIRPFIPELVRIYFNSLSTLYYIDAICDLPASYIWDICLENDEITDALRDMVEILKPVHGFRSRACYKWLSEKMVYIIKYIRGIHIEHCNSLSVPLALN